MNPAEVEAVIGHEMTHVTNGDMVTLTLIQGVMNTFVIFLSRVIGNIIDRTVFRSDDGRGIASFLVIIVLQVLLGILANIIVMWFSRRREFRADRGGAHLAGTGNMIAALDELKRVHEPLPTPQLAAFGIAGGEEKGSYVATCADVFVDRSSGKVQVVRLVTAFECGAILNPDNLKNQIEGAVVMGLGGALFEAIRFADGKILNASFSRYRVPRFSDVQVLETVLLDRKDLPSAGAGETPIVAVAPAIGNAIFHATGVRLRSMPMVPNGFKVS